MKVQEIGEFLNFNNQSIIIRLYDTKLETYTDTEITRDIPFENFCDLSILSIEVLCYDEVQTNPSTQHELCLVISCW